jgi:hypothetical protein
MYVNYFLLSGLAFRARKSQIGDTMRIQKKRLIALMGLAFMLAPTLSTVGVTGADNLNTGKTAITQAIPLKSNADSVLMTAIDTQISLVVTTQR